MASRALPHHVLITGASSGLGAALARHYALKGCVVSLFGRDAERLEHTARACRATAAEVMVYRCDLRDGEETARLMIAADAYAPVDLLIANAGVGGADALTGPSGETREQAQALVAANFLSVINTLTPLLPRLVARGAARIVMVGSISGFLALPQSPVYCASKSAVHAYGDALRRLLRKSGVGVTVVCPGLVETPMTASLSMPKPFMWTADRSAAHIAKAIERRRKYAVFPWQHRWVFTTARLLPRGLTDRILASI